MIDGKSMWNQNICVYSTNIFFNTLSVSQAQYWMLEIYSLCPRGSHIPAAQRFTRRLCHDSW